MSAGTACRGSVSVPSQQRKIQTSCALSFPPVLNACFFEFFLFTPLLCTRGFFFESHTNTSVSNPRAADPYPVCKASRYTCNSVMEVRAAEEDQCILHKKINQLTLLLPHLCFPVCCTTEPQRFFAPVVSKSAAVVVVPRSTRSACLSLKASGCRVVT